MIPAPLDTTTHPVLTPHPAPPRPHPRRNLLPDQALFLAVCMGGLQRLVLLQCPVPPATLAAIWQHRPQLVLLAGHAHGPGAGAPCGAQLADLDWA